MRGFNGRPCLNGAAIPGCRFSRGKNELHVRPQRSFSSAQLRDIRTRKPRDFVDDPAAPGKAGEWRERLAVLRGEDALFRIERPTGLQREIDRRSYAAVRRQWHLGNRHDAPFLHQRHRLGQVRQRADVLSQRHTRPRFLRCPGRHQDLPHFVGGHRCAVLRLGMALQTGDGTRDDR